MKTTVYRETKYCSAVRDIISKLGHATNADIHEQLKVLYPNVSATTVHRVTARLHERGEIGLAPLSFDGSTRYDETVEEHDHFLCSSCGMLRDAHIRDKIAPIIEETIGDCKISGQLTVSGICKQCTRGNI